ncbi:hypothetical protein NEFER03_1002 [Nematocida sp. LUAm3]|nr:hypothetical protein NEFER03_1002 [Nematocida sp. LUAm3]KAI5175394.1 hypothetical protein NEFER02_1323 [Nematocida sp. LUAm2]KAI5177649.1 hypothetical protein NEFER01_0873 [Nematocida sp. LUAm1]
MKNPENNTHEEEDAHTSKPDLNEKKDEEHAAEESKEHGRSIKEETDLSKKLKEARKINNEMINTLNRKIDENSLSSEEILIARFMLSKLSTKANPFLSQKVERKPEIILECWEARDTTRISIIVQEAQTEKNLLVGYTKIYEKEDSIELKEELEKRIESSKTKIYFLKKQLSNIKDLMEDAEMHNACLEDGYSIIGRKKEGPMVKKKRKGTINLILEEVFIENPLHKDPTVCIYLDNSLVYQTDQTVLKKKAQAVILSFNHAQKVEITLYSSDQILIGWIYFPIENLTVIANTGTHKLYYNIMDNGYLPLTCVDCILEQPTLERTSITMLTRKSFEHIMRYIEDRGYYFCCVCHNTEHLEGVYYKCDSCKFTCHLACIHRIFFRCPEYLLRMQEEKTKQEIEMKMLQIKKDRLKMIIAAIDIREKPESGLTATERLREPISTKIEPIIQEAEPPKRKYNAKHTLKRKKIQAKTCWCYHCGERISMMSIALQCTVCGNVYHTSCKDMIFNSCGLTKDILTSLMLYIPTKKPINEENEITLKEIKFISVIGKGSFGKIFLCEWKGKKVALKSIAKAQVIERHSGEYIEIERKCMEIATSCKCLYLIDLYGCFQTPTHIFFIMEYAPGGDLYYHREKGSMPPKEIQLILAQIVLGIDALHQNNIIYRDLKLDNILFSSNGHIKITDFGLSSIGAPDGIAHTYCGTLYTMAPEVIKGEYTKTVDWWSLGVIAYMLVYNMPPFSGETTKAIEGAIENDYPNKLNEIEEPLASFITDLLVKDPESRLGTKSIAEIFNHPYFADIDWKAVKSGEMTNTWETSINTTDNFDASLKSEEVTLQPGKEIPPESEIYFQNF